MASFFQSAITAADMKGAALDNAIWIDKRVCAEGSVGHCLDKVVVAVQPAQSAATPPAQPVQPQPQVPPQTVQPETTAAQPIQPIQPPVPPLQPIQPPVMPVQTQQQDPNK